MAGELGLPAGGYGVQDVGPTHFVNASVSDKVYAPVNPPVVDL